MKTYQKYILISLMLIGALFATEAFASNEIQSTSQPIIDNKIELVPVELKNDPLFCNPPYTDQMVEVIDYTEKYLEIFLHILICLGIFSFFVKKSSL